MALLDVTLTMRDIRNSFAYVSLHCDAQDFGDVVSPVNALVSDIGAMSGAVLSQVSVLYRRHLSDDAPLTGEIVQRQLVLVFDTDTVGQYIVVCVPCVRSNLVQMVPPYVAVDMYTPAIQAASAQMIAIGVCNPSGAVAVALSAALYVEVLV